jgi:NAD(P)-dependent dehydrogenase (short-subunit alcohol dehydrogenase family)
MTDLELSGRVALVTGGSRGIGAATVLALAKQGADVAFTFQRNGEKAGEIEQQVTALGRRVLAMQVDSADPDAVIAAVDRTVEAFGRIDILVNNAGTGTGGPFGDVTVETFDRLFAIHARAPFFAAQAAAKHMGAGGRIISIGTNMASRVAGPGLSLYVASKSALGGMTRALARELGPQGITVNTVDPGSTDTDMNPAAGPRADAQRAKMAIPRYGTQEDIAGLVAYLASEQARFVTGAGFAIDGGVNT